MLLPAVCPHCHDAELQVPAELRGKDVICRRCGKSFLFQPAGRSAFDSDAPPRKKKSAGATVTATPPAATPPAPIPAPTVTSPASPDESPDYALWFALAGAGLFGPAIVATQFPYGRIIAAVLLLIGLAFAAIGLTGLEVKRWAGWLGLGANAVGLILVTLLPGWLGGATWVPPKVETAEYKVPMAVTRDGPARPVSWVEAGNAVWEMGDVRVAVTAAGVDPPPKAGPPGLPDGDRTPTLRLTVQLTNMGVARTIEFPGWFPPPAAPAAPAGGPPPPPAPKLTADGKPVPAKPPGTPESAKPVHPTKSIDTTLLFAVPPSRGDLRLELPSEPFGGKEPVRFQIPWAMVARQNLVPAKPTTP